MNNNSLKGLGLELLSQDELKQTNGGGPVMKWLGECAAAVVNFLEDAGKAITEANEHLPTYAQYMK